MSRSFRRQGDRIRWDLESYEITLLTDLRASLRRLLEHGDPHDPVIARLFPRVVADDDAADAELRMLMGMELLTARIEGLEALLEVLTRARPHRGGRLRVELEDDEPPLVLGVLNDLRLALGAQVGIEQLERRSVDEDDPVAWSLAVMDHLAWLQEQLIAIIDPTAVYDPRI